MKYIIALMGPSQSGKSFVIKKILNNFSEGFKPVLVAKQTLRALRIDEQEALARGEQIDVEPVEKITADLVYQTYGKRTGVSIDKLVSIANEGCVPVVVINDIMAMAKLKKECLKHDKDICVISVFLFRRIPVRNEYFEESKRRGNVNDAETEQRFDKAKTVYRIFIENMHMFDFVMLNTVPYKPEDLWKDDTIIDAQIRAIRDSIILKNTRPHSRKNKEKPVLYVISGNGASGKDELIEATFAMGKLYAGVIPKYTSRSQKQDDGPEIICKHIRIEGSDEFVINPEYESFLALRKQDPDRFLSYWGNGGKFEYTIDMKLLRESLGAGRSQVIALSDIDTINTLLHEFGDQVVPVYCNSQISKEEYGEKGEGDEIDNARLAVFEQQMDEFIENYMLFRHVVIYAENKLDHESDGRQEELIDQLFRLFRAYEEQWI